ncbi:MAG: Gfo/Idh/MocA family oxidoreductase [Chthoniobacterales bacterium]|nr:Gfo/Idh/MocA family oxidoreductase [Chthoniobacterales bacterium]
MSHSAIQPMNIGIIGCGNIFGAYAKGCAMFRMLHLKSCADINPDAAAAKAKEYDLKATSISELLADPSIDLVINLTVPKAHAKVSMEILRAGKHVYSEKTLALDVASGTSLLDYAAQKNLRVGCAPDTFLGAGLQTARKLIDDGWVGRPLSATAFLLASGPESWHPNPAFFYEQGAGPMFDMGPYYITALVHLLGPVAAVCAMTSTPRPERMATCKEQFGKMLPVEVPTHYSGSLLFASGAVITMAVSFDVVADTRFKSPIEIYGSEGSLGVPDPNTFDGPVSLCRSRAKEWQEIPLAFNYAENSRGIGVADMVHAIRSGRPHRCDGNLALHVLEVITAFEKSSSNRSWIQIHNNCAKPAPLPTGLTLGLLDD